jgi:hypothetical protein
MITQILGVALISLLTITPTIQQNNIDQLIAPNIEIQPMIFNTPDSNRLWVANQFSHYASTDSSYNDSRLFTNSSTYINRFGSNRTYDVSREAPIIHIMDNNFYVHGTNILSANVFRDVIRNYYSRKYGSLPTNSTFSFTQTTAAITPTTSFYTYTLTHNSYPTMEGRVYVGDTNVLKTFNSLTINNNVSISAGTTLESLIVNSLQPNITWTISPNEEVKVLYYWLDSSLPLNTVGTYTRTLYARNNYGEIWTGSTFTVTINEADLTPPNILSITGNSTNWTNQNITLIIQANDNVLLNSLAYSFDDGVTYQSSNQMTFTTNQFVNIRVRDSSNNFTNQQIIINRIDKQSPAIILAGNWKNTFELAELANNQSLLSYLSISDNASGLNEGLTSISNFNYNQAGSYSNIQVSATDNAGNNFVYTLPTVTITQPSDNTGPIITGPTTVNTTEGNITTQSILDLYSISDISGIEPNTISIRDLNNNVITNWSSYVEGSYQLRIYARDTLNNVTQYQFTLQVGQAPPPDLTPPTIVGPLLVSFEIGTYTSNTEILNLYTFSDNVAILQNQLIGEIDYTQIGDFEVIIRSIDTSNNVSNKNVVIRIRDTVVLGNYNPLTDLLSGIFGGALSMIFTIGTINVLGLRLLDAMGVIILGTVLLFVYKAIKGGS